MSTINKIKINNTEYDLPGGGSGSGDMLASDYDPTSAVKNAGGIPAYVTGQIPSISGKADKVTGATSGNLAGLDASGNITDSGRKAGVLQINPTDATFKSTPGAIWIETGDIIETNDSEEDEDDNQINL